MSRAQACTVVRIYSSSRTKSLTSDQADYRILAAAAVRKLKERGVLLLPGKNVVFAELYGAEGASSKRLESVNDIDSPPAPGRSCSAAAGSSCVTSTVHVTAATPAAAAAESAVTATAAAGPGGVQPVPDLALNSNAVVVAIACSPPDAWRISCIPGALNQILNSTDQTLSSESARVQFFRCASARCILRL